MTDSTAPIGVKVAFDMQEISDISVNLLQLMEDGEVTVAKGVAALALTLGRLASEHELTVEQEIAITQGLLEYIGMYFAEGSAN